MLSAVCIVSTFHIVRMRASFMQLDISDGGAKNIIMFIQLPILLTANQGTDTVNKKQ